MSWVCSIERITRRLFRCLIAQLRLTPRANVMRTARASRISIRGFICILLLARLCANRVPLCSDMNLMASRLIALALLVLFVCTLQGQTPTKTTEPQGGVSTGAARDYKTKRTVDVTDPSAPVVFTDVTDKTPLRTFVHRSGTPQKNYIFETPSGAVALLDYDGDELLDIYLLNGSTVPALQGKEKPPRSGALSQSRWLEV